MKKKLSFEQAADQLEEIIQQMETKELPIEQAVEQYKKAMDLITHCNSILQNAKLNIETIKMQEE